MSLFEELKRRNVFRVAAAYALAAWVLLQAIDFVLDAISAPNWILQVFILAAAAGFLVVLVFSWVFEVTPEGIKREKDIDRTQSIAPHTGRKLDRVIIAFLVLAVAVLLADRFLGTEPNTLVGGHSAAESSADSRAERAPTETGPANTNVGGRSAADAPAQEILSREKSIAVLPFVNMSDDAENEYFSDGISEELLNVLVRIEGLRVPSRTSSFTFKGSDKKIAEIGRELNVDNVLEGSVRKAGNRIRVTAQLIDVNTDTHLWSETYTREVDDIFAVQDEIAQAIVSALQVTLSSDQQNSLSDHSTENVAAYNKYLLGRHLWSQRTPEALLAAIKPLQEAVEIDPNYDQAWAALAETYALLPEYGAATATEAIPLGRQAAERALAINPESARALTALGYMKAVFGFDWEGGNADFEKALQLDPGYATAHHWYAEVLYAQRRTDEALDQMRMAIVADPLSAIVQQTLGWLLICANRLEEAHEQLMLSLEIDPHMPTILANLKEVNMLRGNYSEARANATEYGRLVNTDMSALLAVIDAMENPALKKRALGLLQEASQKGTDFNFQNKATYALMLGEQDLALNYLEQSMDSGEARLEFVNNYYIFDPLRDNPRFQALLSRINLWP